MSPRARGPWPGAAVAFKIWPWKAATVTGLLVGGAWFALAASGGDIKAITIASPASLGLVAFFLIGAMTALAAKPGMAGSVPGTADEQAWARRHPWAFALWPALGTAVTVFIVRRTLALWNLEESVLSTAFDGLGRGAAVLVCAALFGMAVARRS
ncbi:hypothetical protein ACFMQL_37235 [Nonomuraea fastidiosa]|uniref:hypothetical protein n=1 Tax=Nonomuraea TaxID=83681 RepID=UPI003418DCD4